MPSTRRFPGVEEGARVFSRHNLQVLYYPADHVWAVLAVHANFPLSVPLTGTEGRCRSTVRVSRSPSVLRGIADRMFVDLPLCGESRTVTLLGAIEPVAIPRQVGIGANRQHLEARRLHELFDELRRAGDERRVEVNLGCEHPSVIVGP